MFEIFAKNMDNPSDKFDIILDSSSVNENPELDSIIPFTRKLKTDHLILRGEYEKISIAIYGKLLSPEEISSILSKQFDMPQQAIFPLSKKEEISSKLPPEDEKILEEAIKCLKIKHEPEKMIDVKQKIESIDLLINCEELKGKIEGQSKNIFDVYDAIATGPNPSSFCILYQDLILNIGSVFYIKLIYIIVIRKITNFFKSNI